AVRRRLTKSSMQKAASRPVGAPLPCRCRTDGVVHPVRKAIEASDKIRRRRGWISGLVQKKPQVVRLFGEKTAEASGVILKRRRPVAIRFASQDVCGANSFSGRLAPESLRHGPGT